MPKIIITEQSLQLALHELDCWKGKLTWDKFARKLSLTLGVKSISRHTLLSYPALVDAFKDRKEALRVTNTSEEKDITVEHAMDQITLLEAKLERLEKQNQKLLEQFVRWQHNLYMMPNVDINTLNKQLNKPLHNVNRR